jgi:hypothetical protein
VAYNPKYQVNLSKTFSRAFADKPSKVRDQLRPILSNGTFKATFGKMIVDKIIERTLSGVDRDNVKFAAYSKSYRDSDVFKIYNKSPGDVNLKLTGEMLASLVARPGSQILSVELLGAENQAKAHGHVYGLGKKRVRRDFLGLPDKELEELMRQAVSIASNDAYQAAVEYYEHTSIVDVFGQVGNQPEFNVSVMTPEVLAMLAEEYGN